MTRTKRRFKIENKQNFNQLRECRSEYLIARGAEFLISPAVINLCTVQERTIAEGKNKTRNRTHDDIHCSGTYQLWRKLMCASRNKSTVGL